MRSGCALKSRALTAGDEKITSSRSVGKTQSRLFFTGAALLALSGVIVKLIGMLYKIPLTNLMGDSGMGYFNSAYTIYTFFLVLSSSGLPSAVSLAVSEARAKGLYKKVSLSYKYSLIIFTAVGGAGTLAMLLFPHQLAAAIGNEDAAVAIAAAAPTVVCMCVISALRGYFQGHQYMAPTALSQISESAGKLVFGMVLALYSSGRGNPVHVTAAYAVAGLSLGTFVTMVGLLAVKKRDDVIRSRKCRGECLSRRGTKGINRCKSPVSSEALAGYSQEDGVFSPADIVWDILKTSLPIMIGSLTLTLASSSDLFLVMRILQKLGFSAQEANAAWGNYSAMAVPLFSMPSVLTLPIAMSVCPVIRACVSSGQGERALSYVKGSFMLTAYVALPCTFGLAALSQPILSLIFKNSESACTAASLLTLLSASVFPLALLALTNTVLQAYGRVLFPVFSMCTGIILKISLSQMLIGTFGMKGVPIGTFICYTVICSLNLAYLSRFTGKTGMISMTAKPFCAAFICAAGSYICYVLCLDRLGGTAACLTAIAVAVIIYFLAIILTGGIKLDSQIRSMIPNHAAEALERARIIRPQ